MIEDPPSYDIENFKPESDSSFTDSMHSKGGCYTPILGEKLREIKQLLGVTDNLNFERESNPVLGDSASSLNSKDVFNSAKYAKRELEEDEYIEPLPSVRHRNMKEIDLSLVNICKKDEIVAPPLMDELGSSFYDDSDSSEDEGLPDYKAGGYHPVHVGEVYAGRYIILQKLGWGHFSTVWLSKDLKYDTYVALKVQKSASHYIEAAYDEVEILSQVSTYWKKQEWQDSLKEYYKDDPEKLKEISNYSKCCHTVQLLNSFTYNGPFGTHFVMVFEILGVNLLEIIKRYDYRGVPVPLVRELTKQCLIGLDYLHRICKLIHTDLKPENVVLSLTKQELQEIRDKGMLTTTKMYNRKNDIIQKTLAGATKVAPQNNDNERINRYSRNPNLEAEKGNKNEEKCPETDRSFCDSTTNKKDKQRQRKNKKKKIKKYIKQGKLPVNYGTLPQEEKDRLYNEIRKEIETKSLKESGVKMIGESERRTQFETDCDEAKFTSDEIEIDINQVSLNNNSHSQSSSQHNRNDDLSGTKVREKTIEFNIPKINTEILEPNNAGYDEDVKTTRRGPKLDENAHLIICDMGNGCWTHHHFTSQIQTRQYRSPETIIGVPYGPSADIWSLGCMVFELLTGDFVFEPKKGYNYGKDDDHLAQMIELLGPFPKNMALSGKNSQRYFDRSGHLRRIRGLNYWPLERVLNEKYKFKKEEAELLADFIRQTFIWDPEKRATAQELLNHPWLKMDKNYNTKIPDDEHEIMMNEIRKKEEMVKRKKELEIILKEGSLPPEEMQRRLHSENNSELQEDDFELNAADFEDMGYYSNYFDDDNNEEDEISLGYGDSDADNDELFQGGGFGKGKALNNSFTGPYTGISAESQTKVWPLKHSEWFSTKHTKMKHIHVDRGENQQFQTLK